jgi:hypothetical protein
MSIVACPRCRDEVTLPAQVSPQARVRCPLCRDEYILSEALAKMPPALIVLDAGPGLDEPAYGQEAFGEPDYKVAGDAAPGGMFDASPGEGLATPVPRPKTTGARPKKKSASAVGQIIQVVMGGIGAIVLFHVLAWWTPFLNYQDPLGIAPTVAKYVPALVPEKVYKPKGSSGQGAGGENLAKTNSNGAGGVVSPPVPDVVKNKKKKNGGGAGGGFDTGDKFKNIDPNGLNPDLAGGLDPGLNPALDAGLDAGPAPAIPPEEGAPATNPLDPLAADPLATDPLAANPPKPEMKPEEDKPFEFKPPMPKPVDPNAKPPVGSFELTTAYAAAIAKRESFDQSGSDDPETRKQKGRDMFDAAAGLGKVAADADLTEADLADLALQIKEFAVMLNTQLPFVNFFAIERITAPEAPEAGVVFGGKVTDFKSVGDLFETTVELPRKSGPVSVAVVTTKSLQDEGAKIGDTAIVLGKIIRDPAKDLPKYKGESPVLIQSGHTSLIPAQ